MTGPYTREKIENWAGDFVHGPAIRRFPSPVQEAAPEILTAFLLHACQQRDIEPEELAQGDLRDALCLGAGARRYPPPVPEAIADLCATFLTDLEEQGRLDGQALGQYVRALRPVLAEHLSDATPQLRAPGSKLGRNDPCPCGSGKKFKKCCMGRS